MAMPYDIATFWNYHQQFHHFYNFNLQAGLTSNSLPKEASHIPLSTHHTLSAIPHT